MYFHVTKISDDIFIDISMISAIIRNEDSGYMLIMRCGDSHIPLTIGAEHAEKIITALNKGIEKLQKESKNQCHCNCNHVLCEQPTLHF